ncbi:aminotransferase class V-fold PLP-dependent enzyme, partial [Christensenellaceae bacterium OttesenSCG-928-K19]|nr:aminotransferase class V-fold PLP-dependent enzyme [Christensenellaceae bacterium OttesenSCG-928-K19]
ITELPGADNLYMPAGVIRESQALHAGFIHAGASFLLVNGSSCGVHAAMLSVLKPGDKIIVARDMHLSAVHGLILAGAVPVFMIPQNANPELPGVITPQDVRTVLAEHPDAKAVYLTYPNYYGMCCDLNEICAIVHNAGKKVICDAAHAAAFDFSPLMPDSPAAAGCDIWVTSLHKTLPAMNQCATLCVGEDTRLMPNVVQSRLNMLQTTSPSYVLLASADYALGFMRERGKEALGAVINLVEDNIRKIEAIGGYRVVTKDVPPLCGAYDRDVLKLVIDVTDRGVSGFGAAKALQKQGVYIEAADSSNIILLCTVADGKAEFDLLRAALSKIKGANYHIKRTKPDEELQQIYRRKPAMSMREAVYARRRSIPMIDAVGEVSAVCVGAYPPGVPIILPGQSITYGMVDYIARMRQAGYSIFGTDGSIEVADV